MRTRLLLKCNISKVTIDSSKTALVIIDTQNYSIDDHVLTALPSIDTSQVEEKLLKQAVTATSATESQVVWLNWVLTEKDLSKMPPSAIRVFNRRAHARDIDYGPSSRSKLSDVKSNFLSRGKFQRNKCLGADLGPIKPVDRQEFEAGRALMSVKLYSSM